MNKVLCLGSIVSGLLFATQSPAQGLKGEYYRGFAVYPSFPDDLAFVRIDPVVAFSDNTTVGTQPFNLPAGVGPDLFTVRWSGVFNASTAGEYSFELLCDNYGVLDIDGANVVELRAIRPPGSQRGTIQLTAGPHLIELYYSSRFGASVAKLSYAPPGEPLLVPVPSTALNPTSPFGPNARLLDFDSIANGTFLTSQLSASHGLEFDTRIGIGVQFSRPRVQSSPFASSSPNLLLNYSLEVIESIEDTRSDDVPLRIFFTIPQLRVACNVGDTIPQDSATAVLKAFSFDGTLVGADVVSTLDALSRRLQVSRTAPDISQITIDFGSKGYGERIDDLTYETTPDAPPPPPDLEAPVITILSPADGAVILGDVVTVRGIVRENSGLIDEVNLDGQVTALASFLGCNPPFCRGFIGSVTPGNGLRTLTVRARDRAGNESTASVTVQVVTHTTVRVEDENGVARPGAQVYANGAFAGITDGLGQIEVRPPLSSGGRLAARWRVHESSTGRGSHNLGSTQNWKYRAYITSVGINDDGTTAIDHVTDPIAVQVLTVRRENALIGLNLITSLEWDATESEILQYSNCVRYASEFLFNATDGQMLIEQMQIVDNCRLWDPSDFRVYANASLRAHVDCPRGGFFGDSFWCGDSWMRLSRINDARTFIHEFGHYGLDLADEYSDASSSVRCTLSVNSMDPLNPFRSGASKASCIMWNQWSTQKICSDHPDNLHNPFTRQGYSRTPPFFPPPPARPPGTDCWSDLEEHYDDSGNRWIIQTPLTRSTIVDRIPNIPIRDWLPVIMTDNVDHPALCGTVTYTFVTSSGNPMEGLLAYLDTGNHMILQGTTGANGAVTFAGVHRNDHVVAVRPSYFGGAQIVRSQIVDFCTDQTVGRSAALVFAPEGTGGTSPGPDLNLTVALEPTSNPSQALIRVQSNVALSAPPTVQLRLVGPNPAEPVPTTFDPISQTYVGTLQALLADTEMLIQASATDANGNSVTNLGLYGLSPIDPLADTSVFSADGQIELTVPVGALPVGARLSVGPALVVPQIAGLTPAAQPVTVLAADVTRLDRAGVLRFQLARVAQAGSDFNFNPDSLTVFHFDPGTGQWRSIGGLFLPDQNIVTVEISELGTFALLGCPHFDHRGSALFLNCGAKFTLGDAAGNLWVPDAPFLHPAQAPSQTWTVEDLVNGENLRQHGFPLPVLQSARSITNDFLRYRISAPSDNYRVVLYFSENQPIMVGPHLGGFGQTNWARIFNIQVEDQSINAYNPADAAQPPDQDGLGRIFTASEASFDVSVTDGVLDISLRDRGPTAFEGDPSIQGIAIVRTGDCPGLCIERSGSRVILLWPGAGWVLQGTPVLTGQWTDLTEGRSVDGHYHSASLEISGRAQFFRLRSKASVQ